MLLPEALRKLRAVENAGPFTTVAITAGEAAALLDALDLLTRLDLVCDAELAARIREAAHAIVDSR